ncbi:hypothetical protein [Adhaeribacter radiodurans]|uniref:DUF1772 domain-containing protein n=1 Tax=Adhaeribacter radiodurans TaxID=2745197 RepID=A0A7L7L4N3_9BACT|nr:hypothetical protein [Adhaeribacter radiodurans]QMU27768.1 hypothetical protein HUW48_06790 [Adhaeribacter radiodurans]
MNVKDIVYSFACLSFAVVIGAAVYEHRAVVPQWSVALPASLSMFHGKYGLDAGAFWKVIHPVTLLLFILALSLSWKTTRRKNILVTLIGYVSILAITAIYFVPELMALTGTPFSETMDPSLTQRAQLWELLSQIRLAILVVLSIILFLGLTKAADKVSTPKTNQKAKAVQPQQVGV